MWLFLPYIRTELLSSRVQHVSRKPYPYFRSKYAIFPILYQNWTDVLKSPTCVLETLSLFQIKICDFPYPISDLNCFPWGSSMCPGNLIPISDQLTCMQGNIPPRVHLNSFLIQSCHQKLEAEDFPLLSYCIKYDAHLFFWKQMENEKKKKRIPNSSITH